MNADLCSKPCDCCDSCSFKRDCMATTEEEKIEMEVETVALNDLAGWKEFSEYQKKNYAETRPKPEKSKLPDSYKELGCLPKFVIK